MNTPPEDHWLLKPTNNYTNPVSSEQLEIPLGVGRKDVSLTIEHPRAPISDSDGSDLALYVPGWTEYELDDCRTSTARRGLTAASMPHPRDDAIRSLYSFLISSPSVIRNWGQLSSSIWHAHDLHKTESAVMDLLGEFENSGTVLRSRLIKDALSAGKRRRENIGAAVIALADQGYNIHLFGHSLGGIDALMTTSDLLHLIRSLGLMGTAGLIDDDSVTDIVPRIFKTAFGEGKQVTNSPRVLAKMILRTVLFVLEDPALTVREGQYAASGRLHKQLDKIVVSSSMPIVNILGGQDPMFPTARVLRDTENTLFADTVVIPGAGHNFTIHQSGGVAIIALNMAIDLRNRTSSRLETQLHNKTDNYNRKVNFFDMTDEDVLKDLGTAS